MRVDVVLGYYGSVFPGFAMTLLTIFYFYEQETLGYIDINLSDVVNNRRINERYHLIDSKNGRIQIELQWRTK